MLDLKTMIGGFLVIYDFEMSERMWSWGVKLRCMGLLSLS